MYREERESEREREREREVVLVWDNMKKENLGFLIEWRERMLIKYYALFLITH